jgi:membrane protein DedA with SNARE-associated domain
MSITSAIIDPLLNFRGVPAYSVVGGLAFAEAAIFVGFVLPGETAVILGGVLAFRHSVSLTLMMIVVVVAAIAGDSVGFEVGRHYGERLLRLKVFANGRQKLRDNGGKAVFLARFTAFLRAVMPGMAGTAKMPYRKFLAFNAAGGIVWGVSFTLLGYLAGASYKRIESYAGRFSEAILALVVIAVIVLVVRHRMRERRSG